MLADLLRDRFASRRGGALRLRPRTYRLTDPGAAQRSRLLRQARHRAARLDPGPAGPAGVPPPPSGTGDPPLRGRERPGAVPGDEPRSDHPRRELSRPSTTAAPPGIALSFTNVSLVPDELLACGVIPVTNEAPYARGGLDNPHVRWTAPTPYGLADALSADRRRRAARHRRWSRRAFAQSPLGRRPARPPWRPSRTRCTAQPPEAVDSDQPRSAWRRSSSGVCDLAEIITATSAGATSARNRRSAGASRGTSS